MIESKRKRRKCGWTEEHPLWGRDAILSGKGGHAMIITRCATNEAFIGKVDDSLGNVTPSGSGTHGELQPPLAP